MPSKPAQYRAPRCDDGYELETVRRKLALRAGLSVNDGTGTLRGYIDAVDASAIEGWAQNAAHPEAPVCLDIYAGGRLIGQVLANQYRADLEFAGLGSGRHGFVFTPPEGVALTARAVEVRRSLDGQALTYSRAPGRAAGAHHSPNKIRQRQ
jgi:hypothetical protein